MTTPPVLALADRVAQIVAEIKAKDGPELNHVRHSERLVACPLCKMPPGMGCETTGGWQLLGGVHAGRRDAIARMSLDEKLAAYAGRKAGQEQARAEAEAERDRFYADPAKVAALHAGWEAQRRAWNEMNAGIRAEEREKRARCREPFLHADNCRCRDPQWTPPPPPVSRYGAAPVADLAADQARRTP